MARKAEQMVRLPQESLRLGIVCIWDDQDGFDGREGRQLLRTWTREQLHKANQEECRVGFQSGRFNVCQCTFAGAG